MSGIAGVMTRNGSRPEVGLLDRLRNILLRRGLGGTATHVSDSTGMVGSRPGIAAAQGCWLPPERHGGAILVTDAATFNDQALQVELEGVRLLLETGGKEALHLYRRKALGLADNLPGGYAIAIYDPILRRLILSRDPFGIKPLYYCITLRYFAFASTPTTLIAAGLADTRIGAFARAELLRFTFTSGRSTIFSEIRRVLPGETLIIPGGRITERHLRKVLPEEGPAKISSEV